MQNVVDPAILFFVFGVFAGLARSNLEIPPAISRFLSLYLLMALGLKGGFALAASGLNAQVLISLGAAVAMASAIPMFSYVVLKKIIGRFDAAAIAATYGSVSAVTFITAVQYLDTHQLPYGGHMAAAMALMESPAILLAVFMANKVRAEMRSTPINSATPARPASQRRRTRVPQRLLGQEGHHAAVAGLAVELLHGLGRRAQLRQRDAAGVGLQAFGQQARHGVRIAARREGHDDRHGTIGPGLRLRASAKSQRHEASQTKGAQHAP